MLAVETLVAIAVAKMVAQKLASCSLAPLKVYCCSLFCSFRDDLEDLEKELLCLETQLKEKDKWLFGIEVADEAQTVLAQNWHRDAKLLAFEIEDTIDEFVCSEELYHESTCAHKASLLCSYSNPIAARVWTVKRMILETKKLNSAIKLNDPYGTGPTGIGLESGKFAEKETTSYDGPDEVIGRATDLEAIVDIIKEHAKRLSIIAVVGPVGVGKTCLARLVFNYLDNGSRFTRRIWVYVHKSCSRVDIERIGRQVVSQGLLAGEERPNSDYTMQEITTKVHEILKRERCLIVLDGLWGTDDDVHSLKQMFTSCSEETESVIMVTTHNEQIAQHMSTLPLYRLAPMLEGDYCSDIFVSALCGRNSLFPRYRKEIISRCEGIPLVSDFLGSVLRSGGWDQRAVWENARGKDLWKLEEDYATTLSKELTLFAPFRLMFYNIPHGLRLCFAYCSVFPKGSRIHKRKLIQQWISLNMVEPATHGSVTAEMNAETIIKQLKAVHLLQVDNNAEGSCGATGEILHMHYMSYELARFISNKDILVVLEGEEAFSSFPHDNEVASRTCCFSQENKQASLTYCDNRYAQLPVFTRHRPQKVRSLILRSTTNLQEHKSVIPVAVSEVISGNKYLRVLDLSGCGITELPDCVSQLKQLRYLDVSNLDMKELPCVDSCLRKLVYLNLQVCRNLRRVHESFGMLPSLKYLNLSLCVGLTKLPASFKRLRSPRQDCIIDLSGCQESVVLQFNSELEGDQIQPNQVPDPQPDQSPQPDKVPDPEPIQCHQPAISSTEDKIMGSLPGLPLESNSLVDVANEQEESQPSLDTNPGHCASSSSSNSTSRDPYDGKTADMRGTVRPSISLQSSLVESVKRHTNGTKVPQPVENSVQSTGGCQDLESTSQGPRKGINMAAEEIDVVITRNQHEDLPIPPNFDSCTSSVDANGSKLEYTIEQNTSERKTFIPNGEVLNQGSVFCSSCLLRSQDTKSSEIHSTTKHVNNCNMTDNLPLGGTLELHRRSVEKLDMQDNRDSVMLRTLGDHVMQDTNGMSDNIQENIRRAATEEDEIRQYTRRCHFHQSLLGLRYLVIHMTP
ncbi:unnamed protein product [Urochloa decumbens]|uniref:AAA+ ATPase domain-containing protein n=1 Tax=Urochloa decumbens TaxID=240449 RepID=A0ABC9EVR3_9POAL